MDLWIVFGGWNYEGEEVVGVFDNEDLANKVCDEVEVGIGGYEYVDVRKFVLNEKVEN